MGVNHASIADWELGIGDSDSGFYLQYSPTLNHLSSPQLSQLNHPLTVPLYSVPVRLFSLYTRTSVGRALRISARELEEGLAMYVADEKSSAELCSQLLTYERTRTTLQTAWTSIVEPVVRRTLWWFLHRESVAARESASRSESPDSSRSLAPLDRIQKALDRQLERSGVSKIIADTIDTYSVATGELLSLLALDPPQFEAAMQRSTTPTQLAKSVNPATRLEILAAAVDDIPVASQTTSVDVVAGSLREQLGESVEARTADDSSLSAVLSSLSYDSESEALPLLDHPAAVRTEQRSNGSFVATDRQLSRFLLKVFSEYGLGAVIYSTRGDGSLSKRWQTNPLVDRDRTDSQPYVTRWQRAILTAHVTTTLLRRARNWNQSQNRKQENTTDEIGCPVCSISSTTCRANGCRFDDWLSKLNERVPALVRELRIQFESN